VRKAALTAVCTLAFMGAGVGGAIAAVYESGTAQFSGTSTYYDKSRIDTSYRNTQGVTWTSGGFNQNIGAEAQTFRDSGALCAVSGMQYQYISSINATLSGSCGPGYYYGRGKAAGWNGNGYNYAYDFRTPNGYFSS
jgi:hypothetical protein